MNVLDYINWRKSYKDMLMEYEDLVCEAEFRAECQREDEQLKRLEETG